MPRNRVYYERKPRDFYPTPAWVTKKLLSAWPVSNVVYEPACGNGAMVAPLVESGRTVYASDIAPVGVPGAAVSDFLKDPCPFPLPHFGFDIVTNPPFGPMGRLGVSFIERALKSNARRVFMLLPIAFDCGKTRRHIFADNPLFAAKIILHDRIKWFAHQTGKKVQPQENHAFYVWDREVRGRPVVIYK